MGSPIVFSALGTLCTLGFNMRHVRSKKEKSWCKNIGRLNFASILLYKTSMVTVDRDQTGDGRLKEGHLHGPETP